jgi:hypothetical protein
MKKILLIACLFLFLLAACAKTVPISQDAMEQKEAPGDAMEKEGDLLTADFRPMFRIGQEVAKRYPPTVFGFVENIGNATGSVKVTARIYYAKVIASERSTVLEDVKPGEKANYSIEFDTTTQWNSYKVFLEPISS